MLVNSRTYPVSRNGVRYGSIILTNSSSTTPVIDMRNWAFGCIIFRGSATTQVLNVLASDEESGNYFALYDVNGDAVTVSAQAQRVVELPTALAGCPFIKLVQATSNDTTPVTVVLKG